jgi:Ser/Thr protein kinase RdoA (MazF antagonist)
MTTEQGESSNDSDVVTSGSFSLVQSTPPPVTPAQAESFVRDLFGIVAVAHSLGSHQDRNFLLQGAAGPMLFKISNPATTAAELAAQNLATDCLAEVEPRIRIPRPRLGLNGNVVQHLATDGQVLHARLLTFVE